MGELAVCVFFIVSGYLVTRSLDQRRSMAAFAAARCLRLFPGLAACVLLAVFVLGPALTPLELRAYFGSGETWTHLVENIVLFKGVAYTLPGVFAGNPYPSVVNGSLWSLPYEAGAYVLTALLSVAGRRARAVILLLSLALLADMASPSLRLVSETRAMLLASYLTGATAWHFGWQGSRRCWGVVAGLGLAAAATAGFGVTIPLRLVALALGVLAFGLGFTMGREPPADISYGLYLYGFPVQQSLMTFMAFNPWQLAAASLLCLLPLAWLSWMCVERPALKQRGALAAVLRRPLQRLRAASPP